MKSNLAIHFDSAAPILAVLLHLFAAGFFFLCPRECEQFVQQQERREGLKGPKECQCVFHLAPDILLDILPALPMTPPALRVEPMECSRLGIWAPA